MSQYWLHVNHPNNKARIHVEGGCAWVSRAVGRIRAGEPYGPKLGDRNGYWDGPFGSVEEAETRQEATGKSIRDRCGSCCRS